MQLCPSTVCLLLICVALGSAVVQGDPEPMARPTRPKVFTSPEELRRYLDLVRDYYSLNGKARYGKRGEISSPIPDDDHPWDALRTILDVRREMQQQKLEKGRLEKEQVYRDYQSQEYNKNPSKLGSRPYIYDVVGKYYEDVQ